MKSKKIAAVFLMWWEFFLPAAGLRAQSPADDYKAVLEEAMKSGSYSQSRSESWDARVKKVSGSVKVKPSGAEEWSELRGEMPLQPEDSVKTGSDGSAEIYLDDKGAVSVGRNTELEIPSLLKTDSAFSLKAGFLAAKIQHFLNERFRLQVRAPSAVCAVRGTEFAVEYSLFGKKTGVAVFGEGRMAVTPTNEEGQSLNEYVLEKNTELVFSQDRKALRPAPLAGMRRFATQIAAMRARLKALKKAWKPLTPAGRAAARDRILRHLIRRELDNPGAGKAAPRGPKTGKRRRGGLKNQGRRKAKTPADDGQ